MAETTKVHPDCPNASNPYHECGQYCAPKIAEAAERKGKKNSGAVLLNAPRSFDRRIKESKTQPKPQQVPHSISAPIEGFVANDIPSPPSVFPYSTEIRAENAITPDSPKHDHSKADNPEHIEIHHITPDSDEEDITSMISDSDSRVLIGKYNVKASISTILQAIFNKHGDILANCNLRSIALRAYYLECVCFVVQELQTAPIVKLTNAKLKEMLAILKDVEAAGISVSWLRRVISEIVEIIEPIVLQQAIEAAKASTRRELEAQMEELGVKEKELANVKRLVAESEAKLAEIEIECSEFDKNLQTIRSKVENFDFKALLDELV